MDAQGRRPVTRSLHESSSTATSVAARFAMRSADLSRSRRTIVAFWSARSFRITTHSRTFSAFCSSASRGTRATTNTCTFLAKTSGPSTLRVQFGSTAHDSTSKPCWRTFPPGSLRITLLRFGGHFMLGWNDVPEYRGAPLDTIQSLRQFSPIILPPLGVHRYLTDTVYRHIYQFYRKEPLSERHNGC
jgi:hypothetical protein